MNTVFLLKIFILLGCLTVILGRYFVDDVSFFKLCAIQIVVLLNIIVFELLRRRK